MNILKCLELAGENLLQCLCPEENYLPYWHMVVWPDRTAEYQFRPHCDGHNVGRWWNAMLRLEEASNFAIPGVIEQAMLENTWRLADNPSGIFLQDIDPEDARTWYIHSYRETMLAFGLLVHYRDSRVALRHGRPQGDAGDWRRTAYPFLSQYHKGTNPAGKFTKPQRSPREALFNLSKCDFPDDNSIRFCHP